jgi:hypothetical protein
MLSQTEAYRSMNLADFLRALWQDGRVLVSDKPLPVDERTCTELLQRMHEVASAEVAGGGPEFTPRAAFWGAALTAHLCRCVVCRDISADEVTAGCHVPCPTPRGPQTDFSADLCLRQLPSIFRLARHLSEADPLVSQVRLLAAQWPLSSVGIPMSAPAGEEAFRYLRDGGLRRLYADRIIMAGDTSRLGNADVDEALREALAGQPELAPAISARVFMNSTMASSSAPNA